MSQLTDAALKVAQSQVGEMENPLGSNWGHPVQDYLASVGIEEAASWCMAFMYWCFNEACKSLSIDPNPLTETGSVMHAWNVAYVNHKYYVGQSHHPPMVGDIFIMDLGKGAGHTGIIEAIDSDGTLHTIEGNTDITGSPNGDGVYRRVRHFVAPMVGVLRYQ